MEEAVILPFALKLSGLCIERKQEDSAGGQVTVTPAVGNSPSVLDADYPS